MNGYNLRNCCIKEQKMVSPYLMIRVCVALEATRAQIEHVSICHTSWQGTYFADFIKHLKVSKVKLKVYYKLNHEDIT